MRGVLRDTPIVCERRDRFSVHELRRTQDQPLRLEDGDTAFSERGRWESVEAGHRRAPLKSTEGEPASRLPLGLGTLKVFPSIRRGMRCRRILKSTVYSAAASVIGRTDTYVRPLAFVLN